jgi:hypothetical protein
LRCLFRLTDKCNSFGQPPIFDRGRFTRMSTQLSASSGQRLRIDSDAEMPSRRSSMSEILREAGMAGNPATHPEARELYETSGLTSAQALGLPHVPDRATCFN